MLEKHQFDCYLRVLKFAKLFIIVEYIPARRMWDAYIFNRTQATTPHIISRSNYSEMLEKLATYEIVEQNGGLKPWT